MSYFVEGRVINRHLDDPGESDYKTMVHADSAAEAEKKVKKVLLDAGYVITALSASKAINSFDRDTIDDDKSVEESVAEPVPKKEIHKSDLSEEAMVNLMKLFAREEAVIITPTITGAIAMLQWIYANTPFSFHGDIDQVIMNLAGRAKLYAGELPNVRIFLKRGYVEWEFKHDKCTPTKEDEYKITASRRMRPTIYDYTFSAWSYEEV